MTERAADLDGRDEPARSVDDHAELLSELDSHDLSLAIDPTRTTEPTVFEFDPDADPARVFSQSVAGGEGVATGERLGVEFMTPAITSLNVAEALHLTRGWRGRLTEPLLSWQIPAMNPHIEFFDSHHWGYSVVEFTPEDCTYVGYAVDKTVNSPDAERRVLRAFRVPEGECELVDVTTEYRS